MDEGGARRLHLLIPMRTLLLVAAAIGVIAAFQAIGDTFLVVFVGISVALVFECPVRFLMAKTRMSRVVAATVAVLGTAVALCALLLLFLVPIVGSVRDYLQELPEPVSQLRESDELSWLGDSGVAENVQDGAGQISVSVPDAVSAVLGINMIPNLGATHAGFILVPTSWAEEGLTAAVIMLAVILVYQQIENNVLTPKIQGKAVQLSGFFIIVAVTFGALLGVLGALTAVPLAATLQILVRELTKARRERVAEAKAGLAGAVGGA